MAATGNEAVKLSQLKTIYGNLHGDLSDKLDSADIVAGTNVTVDTDTQPGKVVISAEGGEQYITSVEPVNMKVADGKLSFTDGLEFFEPMGGGLMGYALSDYHIPISVVEDQESGQSVASIEIDPDSFLPHDDAAAASSLQLTLKSPNNLDLLEVYKSGNINGATAWSNPIVLDNIRDFVMLPQVGGPAGTSTRSFGTSGQVLSTNGDGTFAWVNQQTGGGTPGTGSVGTAQLADSAVTTAKLANDAVTGDKLADNSVAAANLMTGSVTSEKIANGAVAMNDLNTEVTNRLVPTGGSASTFLCGDGTWKTPANITYTAGDGLKLSGTEFSVNFVSDEDFNGYFGL